jgi:3',5'-cyclic AMP phosphodiesterase CpdA
MRRRGPLLALILLLGGVAGAAPLEVVVVSDLNGPYGQIGLHPRVRQAVARIIEAKPDLVISTGDMIAGQQPHPKLDERQLRDMWVEFHRTVTEPLAAAGIPLAITPGNHDASAYAAYAHERAAYARAWADRRPSLDFVDAANYPFRYAFRLGGTQFVALDATRTGPLSDEQRTWLETLLDAAPAGETTVLFGHLPVWPVARGRETEYLDDPALRRLLAEREVEVYLSGHHHAFYAGTHAGTLHVSQPCLGSGPRRLIGGDGVSPRGFSRVTIGADGVAVSALQAPDYRAPIDLAALPASVAAPFGRLRRYEPSPP